MTVNSRYLVRYGAVPEVARFDSPAADDYGRGTPVVVTSPRGLLLGTVLDQVRIAATDAPAESDLHIDRTATADDLAAARARREQAEAEFPRWIERITEWGLQLELVDLELTLDGERRILYVLTERGPESTKLALQAAAAGLGLIEVQPVSAEGLLIPESGGGCGTGGGGCGCH